MKQVKMNKEKRKQMIFDYLKKLKNPVNAWTIGEKFEFTAKRAGQLLDESPGLEHKIAIVHNWANSDLIQPLAKNQNWFAREHHFVDRFTVLYSGNMGRCHDMTTILETVKLLRNDPIQFVFIGNGAKRQAFMETIEQLGLTNCTFLPYQDRQVLPYSLTACDLNLISIDRDMEGLVAPSKPLNPLYCPVFW